VCVKDTERERRERKRRERGEEKRKVIAGKQQRAWKWGVK